MHYLPLVRRLNLARPIYGIPPRGAEQNQTSHDRVEDMAAYYIDAIRSIQPTGPYMLGGSSFAGVIAYEMARQLQNMGESLSLVVLIDTWGPGYREPPRGHYAKWRDKLYRKADRFSHRVMNFLARDTKHKILFLRDIARNSRNTLKNTLTGKQKDARSRFSQATRDANSHAIRCYLPQSYAGRVVLFRAKNNRMASLGTLTSDGTKLSPAA